MSLDFMNIASVGVYPTPGKVSTLRAALAVSMGLLNRVLPGPPEGRVFNGLLKVGHSGIKFAGRMLRIGR